MKRLRRAFVAFAALTTALAACSEEPGESPAPRAGEEEEPPPDAGPTESPAPDAGVAAGSLLEVDLSDEAVSRRTREELWEIGVVYLRWPRELPPDATKHEIHQRLLEGKYSNVGDFGDTGYVDDPSYREDDR